MNHYLARFAIIAALGIAGAAHAADVGRVLLAAGDTVAVRGGQTIKLTFGTAIQDKDVLRTGPASNLQVRFTDESIVSMKESSELRIDDFQFSGKEDGNERAFFRLLKGGLRTVTGIIGRANHKNYQMGTTTATIGIRGTDYAATLCQGDCRNNDGSLAKDGLYGRTHGQSHGTNRIDVANAVDSKSFGINENFYVADAKSLVEPLLVAPDFVSNRLESRRQGGSKGESGGSGTEQSTTGGAAGESRPSTTPEPLPQLQFVATQDLGPIGAPAVLGSAVTGTVFYRLTGPFNLPVTCTTPPCSALVNGDITLAVNTALGVAYIRLNAADSSGEFVNIGNPINSGGLPITVSGSQITFSGTINRVDFPNNQGAFRCSDCSPGGTPGFFDSLSASGTISGSSATVTLSATDTGGSGFITATLTQQTPPNNLAAAMVIQRQGGGSNSISAAYWDVDVDGSGRALRVAQGGTAGARIANVGSSINTVVGSAPAAGNLVWGTWTGGGANITDFDYVSFVTTTGQTQPWITGTATTTLPASSSVTYTPIGSIVTTGNGVLNSALLTADFLARKMAINLNATNTSVGNTFQMNGSSGISPISGRFQAGFSSVTCIGPCSGGSPSGSFAGFFAGANAEGAGVAFNAGFGSPGGVNGVAAFTQGAVSTPITPTIAAVGALFDPFSLPNEPNEGGGFFTASNLVTDPAGTAGNLATAQKLIGFTLPAGFDAGNTPSLFSNVASTSSASVIDETVPNSLNAHWGRWTSGSITELDGTPNPINFSPNNQFHYLYGPVAPPEVVAAKTGTFSMLMVQGTTPTNHLGQTGSLSASPLTVNFTARTVAFPSISMSFPSDTFSFGPSSATIQIRAGQGAFIDSVSSGICSGSTCSTSMPAVLGKTGIFMGPNGDHLGIGFAARTTSGPTAYGHTTKIYSCSPSC